MWKVRKLRCNIWWFYIQFWIQVSPGPELSLLSHHPVSSASRTQRLKGCTDHRSPSKAASWLHLHSLAAWQSTGSLGCGGLVTAGRGHSWLGVFLPHWGRIYDPRRIYGENLWPRRIYDHRDQQKRSGLLLFFPWFLLTYSWFTMLY